MLSLGRERAINAASPTLHSPLDSNYAQCLQYKNRQTVQNYRYGGHQGAGMPLNEGSMTALHGTACGLQ